MDYSFADENGSTCISDEQIGSGDVPRAMTSPLNVLLLSPEGNVVHDCVTAMNPYCT
jgi:hypothetical protein